MKAITVRFSKDALLDLDRVRGRVPREVWIRDLCADAVLAHDMTSGYASDGHSHVEDALVTTVTCTPGRDGGAPRARAGGIVQLSPRGGEVVAMAPAEILESDGERARSLGLTGDASRPPAGGMVAQPRPIVQKASKGKR